VAPQYVIRHFPGATHVIIAPPGAGASSNGFVFVFFLMVTPLNDPATK